MLLSRETLIAKALPPTTTFAVAAAVAASTVYWVFALQGLSLTPPSQLAKSSSAAADTTQVITALGGSPIEETEEKDALSSLRLVGILRQGLTGAALIAVNPLSPAKIYSIGALVQDNWTLKSVEARQAVLSRGGQERMLFLSSAEETSGPRGRSRTDTQPPLGSTAQAGLQAQPVPIIMNAVPTPPSGAVITSSERVGTQDSVSLQRTDN